MLPYMACVQASAQPEAEFSIYCSSNMDGTGKCRRSDTDEALTCLIIPGSVIACRDKQKLRYDCVQYGAILAHQTQFSCTRRANDSINDHLFDDPQAIPTPIDPDESTKPSNGAKKEGTETEPSNAPLPLAKPPEVLMTGPLVDDTPNGAEPPGTNQDFNRAF